MNGVTHRFQLDSGYPPYTSGAYWDKNPGFHEEDSWFKFKAARKLLDKNAVMPGSIVDYGCGGGLLTYFFARHYDVETVGFDRSQAAIERARQTHKHHGLSFSSETLECLEDGRFDLGIMFDVFEHVEDYIGLLRTVRDKARQWLFNVPMDMTVASLIRGSCIRMRDSVGHLHYFDDRTALATLETAEYSIVDTAFANKVPNELAKGVSLSKVLTGIPQLLAFKLSQRISVRLLGGASLLVLCKRRTSI